MFTTRSHEKVEREIWLIYFCLFTSLHLRIKWLGWLKNREFICLGFSFILNPFYKQMISKSLLISGTRSNKNSERKKQYWQLLSLCRALWRILRAKMENILARRNKPIKSENQIIVRSKQPIKIEKPFQSLLTFSRSAGEKNIIQSVLLSFFQCLFPQCPPKW